MGLVDRSAWLLGGWVLVSITADAGVDASAGYQVVAATNAAGQEPERLISGVPASMLSVSLRLAPGLNAPLNSSLPSILLPGIDPAAEALMKGRPPRDDMKAAASGFPQVDRARKGDPAVARLRGGPAAPIAEEPPRVFFTLDPRVLPPTILMPMVGTAPGPDSVASFESAPSFEATTPEALASENSPRSSRRSRPTAASRASGTTTRVASTPTAPRARCQLSSTTPAPRRRRPFEIAAAPVRRRMPPPARRCSLAGGDQS